MEIQSLYSKMDELKQDYQKIVDKLKVGLENSKFANYYEQFLKYAEMKIKNIEKLNEQLTQLKSEMPLLEEKKEKLLAELSDIDMKLNTIMKNI